MESTVVILGKELEYDFLSAWIKYTRIKNGFSQEALAHGICSISHLSYFENGNKHLRKEIIESLLKKLNINNIDKLANIGLVRQKLNNMMNNIEGFNCDKIFDKYLNEQYEYSKYYNAIYFLYLVIHKFNDNCFYDEVKNKILPYYETMKKNDLCKDIKFKLIEYLENNRRYKEANKLYKELI